MHAVCLFNQLFYDVWPKMRYYNDLKLWIGGCESSHGLWSTITAFQMMELRKTLE